MSDDGCYYIDEQVVSDQESSTAQDYETEDLFKDDDARNALAHSSTPTPPSSVASNPSTPLRTSQNVAPGTRIVMRAADTANGTQIAGGMRSFKRRWSKYGG